jgi:hypothetical protein
MEQETLVHELLELMRQQQTQNTKIIESMMEAHAAQAQVFKSWLDMFKPSETPLKATSPEDRVKIREQMEADEWEPMTANPFKDVAGVFEHE